MQVTYQLLLKTGCPKGTKTSIWLKPHPFPNPLSVWNHVTGHLCEICRKGEDMILHLEQPWAITGYNDFNNKHPKNHNQIPQNYIHFSLLIIQDVSLGEDVI